MIKESSKTLILSDIHLGSRGCKPKPLLKTLNEENFDRLILVGDILDIWLLNSFKYFPKEHVLVLNKILNLSKSIPVIYLTGNHDDMLRKYTPFESGNIILVDEYTENEIYFVHGDKFDGINKLKFLSILGSISYDLLIMFDVLFKTHVSKYLKNKIKGAIKYITNFEKVLCEHAQTIKCKTVVCGHIHTPVIKTINNINYINCGDWIENCSYIILENNKFTLKFAEK